MARTLAALPGSSLRNPFFGSVAFHAALFGLLAFSGLSLRRSSIPEFGSQDAGGGAVTVNPVATIPLPSRNARPNPVANESKSNAPAPPPQPKAKTAVREDPNAVPIQGKPKPTAPRETATTRRPPQPDRPNQVYSQQGPALSNPMYTLSGGGKIGIGVANPFGYRFGAYARLLQERIARQWSTAELDPNARPAQATFELGRDGSVTGVRIEQSSGDYTYDQSVLRAIRTAAPLPPLPYEFERSSATVQFTFSLR